MTNMLTGRTVKVSTKREANKVVDQIRADWLAGKFDPDDDTTLADGGVGGGSQPKLHSE